MAPRVAEPVREVITSPDEEILENHDIIESQEPPPRESQPGQGNLFNMERSMVPPKELLSPILGITKEIMSRGPQVLDMEYLEPY
jgi:hypothetical protein